MEVIADNTGPIVIPEVQLYSKRTIWIFSVIFCPIFGAVLLMQNLKDTGYRKKAYQVLALAIAYTIASIVLINSFEHGNTSLTYVLNFIGGGFLTEYYYKKYFGSIENVQSKSIIKPLIISILITIPFIVAIFYTASNA